MTIPSNATAFQTSSPRASLERESNKSFGVDLAIQLAKEGHQRAVPRLLERCVEAIERAGGLEVVGLYRLSGTTSKIARLKARLDAGLSIQLALSLSLFCTLIRLLIYLLVCGSTIKDVEGVKLNYGLENLSELNDLTGALKLWLRELPEPLLTWHLYPGFIEAGRGFVSHILTNFVTGGF